MNGFFSGCRDWSEGVDLSSELFELMAVMLFREGVLWKPG